MKNLTRLFLFSSLALGAVAFASSRNEAHAGAKPLSVVELFTSQGCNSCPPADAYLDELADRDSVVALSYHIDYWDYLGWKDTLGSPQNTARQEDYRRALGANSKYTPQLVINGRTHVTGSDRSRAEALLALGTGADTPVDMDIVSKDGTLVITAGKANAKARDALVILVFYNPVSEVAVKKGENRGRTIKYRNSVTGWQTAGMWHGDEVRIELPQSEMKAHGADDCAVLLQEVSADGLPGPILGAAALRQGKTGL